jgi:hypothetical protein
MRPFLRNLTVWKPFALARLIAALKTPPFDGMQIS